MPDSGASWIARDWVARAYISTERLLIGRSFADESPTSWFRLALLALGLLIGAPLSARLAEHVGAKVVVATGLSCAAASSLLQSRVPVLAYDAWSALMFALFGFGVGMTVALTTDAIMGSVPPTRAGVGSAVNDTIRQTGGALGVAVLGSLAATRHDARVDSLHLPANLAAAAKQSFGAAAELAHRLPGPIGAVRGQHPSGLHQRHHHADGGRCGDHSGRGADRRHVLARTREGTLIMRLAIVAATGGVGRALLEEAVSAEHDVTAVVRDPTRLSRPVRSVSVDLAHPDEAAVKAAVNDVDAVLSGLGPRSKSDTGVASTGTAAIVHAMQATGTRRLVVVSAAPIGTVPSPAHPHPPRHDAGDGFFMRHLFSPLTKLALRDQYRDLAAMEEVVRDSGLEWTIVRPPRLTNRPRTGRYRTAFGRNLRRGFLISRADVADLMLHLIDDPTSIHQVVGVAN